MWIYGGVRGVRWMVANKQRDTTYVYPIDLLYKIQHTFLSSYLSISVTNMTLLNVIIIDIALV